MKRLFCLLDLFTVINLAITNTYFKKHDTHFIISKSFSSTTKLNYILTKRSALKLVSDVKLIKEYLTQHKLIIFDKIFVNRKVNPTANKPKLSSYKLKSRFVCHNYAKFFSEKLHQSTHLSTAENTPDWSDIEYIKYG